MGTSIEQLTINTIRTLSMDGVQKANCGHPGAPMGLAPVGYTIWRDFLRYDPNDPLWINRDRFVLSAGHASMLLYSLIFLAGIKSIKKNTPALELEDLKNFRQLGSLTPGHPEFHLTTGVETTTGPLGQGFANSVGMAMAEKWLAARYNKNDFKIFDHNVYAVGGDGCMMEGVTSEAASLAGHLKLYNLCWFYDNNNISIDGNTKITFTEDVGMRFKAYGWNVLHVDDANDLKKLQSAIQNFLKTEDKPTLIIVDSHIGYGSPKQDKASAHGEPLGDENIRITKKFLGWPEDAKFLVPPEAKEDFSISIKNRGGELNQQWRGVFSEYKKKYPELASEIDLMSERSLPAGWDKDLPQFSADPKGAATRETSGTVLNSVAKNVPWLMGGSADLAASTKTNLKFEGAGQFGPEEYSGRNFHFGIREHAMGSVTNGMTLSGVRAYGSTFLAFNDYQKPSVRLASVMEIPNIFIYSHDSIGLGEDGPTHQPIEQLAALRATPGLVVLRPCDANEVTESWKVIMNLKDQPVALILSRQGIPTLDRKKFHSEKGLGLGGYVIAGSTNEKPDVIILSTGAEVHLCLDAYEKLVAEGIKARVVSLPSWELFDKQTENYRESVLPASVRARVSVEAASVFGWQKYTGLDGANIGMKTFGASAPIKDLFSHFGFTPDKIAQAARDQIKKNRS